jgi:hypothetical protein
VIKYFRELQEALPIVEEDKRLPPLLYWAKFHKSSYRIYFWYSLPTNA